VVVAVEDPVVEDPEVEEVEDPEVVDPVELVVDTVEVEELVVEDPVVLVEEVTQEGIPLLSKVQVSSSVQQAIESASPDRPPQQVVLAGQIFQVFGAG
jgi:hypothetical protein